MPSLKDIRKRIGSVRNTQKITRAMKMVAAARLRRAQQRVVELRPFARTTNEILQSVVARLRDEEELHPLLVQRPVQHAYVLVLTSDRGLAGAFNANAQRRAFQLWKELESRGAQVRFGCMGRKGRDYLARRGAEIADDYKGIFEGGGSSEHVGSIARALVADFQAQKVDAVYVVYNEFRSAITQNVRADMILPLVPEQVEESPTQSELLYEPDRRSLLETLLPMQVQTQLYRALLESIASEHGARMTAMDAATNNAKDMISRLTLQFNRARQAAITKELVEIISGAEAIRD